MLKRIKQLITNATIALTLLAPVALPVTVHAQANISDNLNLGTCVAGENCDDDANESINSLVGSIINIFSLVVGIVSVIMIIVGGFRYITSGGDSNNVTGAKNTILYAIIGLVIVALAQIIVRFVLGRVTES